ncbi:MAG: Bax inhibitor-1/YccA family protein [Firmicutes bacterium]|nr:Bax inhibitor-1/YccA family protein [Bacillota bacterium]
MEEKKLFSKIFLWMFIGLMITFGTAFYVSTQEFLILNILRLDWIWFLLQLGIVIFLSARIAKMNPFTAKLSFAIYSFVTGLTLSYIFIIFQMSSILTIFLASAVMFGIFGLFGYYTKVNLTKLSSILMMGLVGIIIAGVINIFTANSTLDLIISSLGILIFTIFVAYDIQKAKMFSKLETIPEDNLAIYGALNLYLDFINIFLSLLQIFGGSRDN